MSFSITIKTKHLCQKVIKFQFLGSGANGNVYKLSYKNEQSALKVLYFQKWGDKEMIIDLINLKLFTHGYLIFEKLHEPEG